MPVKPEISRFIAATFRSVWALELLLFLRQNRERGWSHGEMVTALRGSDQVVTQGVESLAVAGLVLTEDDDRVRYAPASPELDGLIEGSAAFYAKSPDAVRRLIVSAANPGLTAFADAFRLRKD